MLSYTRSKGSRGVKNIHSAGAVYSDFLGKLWIAALSMAWMNTALGFILPSSDGGESSKGSNSMGLWMRIVSTICLAVLSRSLQPMFNGLSMFQGYIEWNIATQTLAAVKGWSSSPYTSPWTVVCTGLAFYVFDLLQRMLKNSERIALLHVLCSKNEVRSRKTYSNSSRLSSTVETFVAISIIMFTNSLVSWTMDIVSSASGKSTYNGLGSAFAVIVCGLVVARTVVQVVDAYASRVK